MKWISLSCVVMLTACGHGYVLPDSARNGEHSTYRGTVISVEEDGDFVLEVGGMFLFVDNDKETNEVELGDRIIVSGVIDNDKEESEAPELDALNITDWKSSE